MRNQIVAEELEIGFEERQKGVKGDMNVNAHAEPLKGWREFESGLHLPEEGGQGG